MQSTKDIYVQVTQRILAHMETGVKPWEQPWKQDGLDGRIIVPRRHNGQAYRGINVLMLWCIAQERSFRQPTWMTFKQALELGGCVRKGEKASPIIWSKPLTCEEENPEGGTCEVRFYAPRFYNVFNVEQIDGLPERFNLTLPAPPASIKRIEHAEAFVTHTGASIRAIGNKAYYALAPDYIAIPPIEAFKDTDSFYRTIFHELGHWTRHPERLGRDLGRKKWGDEGYAREEMVAELAAAFLSADMRLSATAEDQHAAYIAHWQKALKDDQRFIFRAAALAQQAADYLHNLQPKSEIVLRDLSRITSKELAEAA